MLYFINFLFSVSWYLVKILLFATIYGLSRAKSSRTCNREFLFLPGVAPACSLVSHSPHHCGQGMRAIPLITHVLDLPTHPHGQRLDYTIKFSLCQRWLPAFVNIGLRSEDMRGRGVNLLTGCLRSQHCRNVLQRRSIKAVPTACRTTLVLHSPTCKLEPLRHEWGKDSQSKAPSEIPVLICISWMFLLLEKLCITVEAVCCQTLHMCCNKA